MRARAASASASAAVVVLLLLLLLVGVCAGAVYKVGDLDAWGVPPPSKPDVYKRWAKSIHFALGDSICKHRIPFPRHRPSPPPPHSLTQPPLPSPPQGSCTRRARTRCCS